MHGKAIMISNDQNHCSLTFVYLTFTLVLKHISAVKMLEYVNYYKKRPDLNLVLLSSLGSKTKSVILTGLYTQL